MSADELRCRCEMGVDNVPREEVVEALKARWAGVGVPTETERGESLGEGRGWEEGRDWEGDAL
jgi:hypothetical protein